jgi:lysophospholipase L1-like esterase
MQNGIFISIFTLSLLTARAQTADTAKIETTADKVAGAVVWQTIPAADSRFRYEGRFDFSDSNAPVVIWQASRIRLDFEGDALGLIFDNAQGQNFFNAEVDESNTVVEVPEGMASETNFLGKFGSGWHHLILFKRSEAAAGTVRFRAVEIVPGAQAKPAATTNARVKMQFIGDSITVGACNEDGAHDQWETRRTHNAALSYAALVADAFKAAYRNIAVSGMGITTGWVPMRAGEIWDRLYPKTNSPPADLSSWIPDIVFLNFGENDASFTGAHGQPFPASFSARYVSLVQAVRRAYPAAQIVILRGGMGNGANSQSLRLAWHAAVTQLEANDKNLYHFVFTHWTTQHPRVADDRAMAYELIAWLRRQSFTTPYR